MRASLLPLSLLLATTLHAQQPPALKAAEASVDSEKIRAHVRFLADDLLEGRYPGLRGSDLAAKYIATQFALDGLLPGGDDGTYLQQIDFVGVKPIAEKTSYAFVPLAGAKGGTQPLTFAQDYTVSNQQHTPVVAFNAPLVFVGYGVTAPEFQWNDYAGVDVKGKVIVCIVGDPPSTDPAFFAGDALTYYGRWTYKFEQAARMGAVGALIIHRTDFASYGWDVVKNSNTGEKTYLRDDKNPALQAASWIQLEVARKLFAAGGLDLDREMARAGQRGFHAHDLPFTLQAHVESVIRPFQSANVVGILPAAWMHPRRPTWPRSPQIPWSTRRLSTPRITTTSALSPACPATTSTTAQQTTAPAAAMILELARAWSQLAKETQAARTRSSSRRSLQKNKACSARST